ncbi:MAG: hypothetical protein RL226_4 [Bacteroidota bacterium]|jgi:hypothetical protein
MKKTWIAILLLPLSLAILAQKEGDKAQQKDKAGNVYIENKEQVFRIDPSKKSQTAASSTDLSNGYKEENPSADLTKPLDEVIQEATAMADVRRNNLTAKMVEMLNNDERKLQDYLQMSSDQILALQESERFLVNKIRADFKLIEIQKQLRINEAIIGKAEINLNGDSADEKKKKFIELGKTQAALIHGELALLKQNITY